MIKTKADALKRNRNGAVLVWAMVVLLLLTILIGAVLTLSMAYYTRCVNSHSAKQADFTARSAVDSIAGVLCGTGTNENRDAILSKLTSDGSELNLNDLQFAQQSFGSCSAAIKRESYGGSDTLLITATAVVGKQTKSVSLRLSQSFSFPASGNTIQTINTGETDEVSHNPDFDFYVKNGATLGFDHNASYDGNIYAESNSLITIPNGAKFSGKIYLQSGAIINYSKLHNKFIGKIYTKSGSVITINDIQITVTIQPDDTISFSPSDTGLDILKLFDVNDWNRVSGSGGDSGGDSDKTSLWSPMQYEPG